MTICNSPQTCGLDSQIIHPRRKLPTNWQVFGVILLCLVFSQCKVALVPPYDAGVEQQIVNTAKMNDRLYLEMQDEPVADRTYTKYSSKYLDIESEINSILLKNEARKQSHDLIVITNNLKTLFVQFKDKHKQDNTINDADIKLNQLQIAAAWKALLVAERGLKLGE